MYCSRGVVERHEVVTMCMTGAMQVLGIIQEKPAAEAAATQLLHLVCISANVHGLCCYHVPCMFQVAGSDLMPVLLHTCIAD
jgi:hypothetical protein